MTDRKRKPAYTILPQRNDGRGWAACSEHRATGWLVVNIRSGASVARWASKRQASEHLASLQAAAKPARTPAMTLGARVINACKRPVLLRSMTKAEYLASKGLDA